MARMTDKPTSVARLTCDEPTARRLSSTLGEIPDNVAVGAVVAEDSPYADAPRHRRTAHYDESPASTAAVPRLLPGAPISAASSRSVGEGTLRLATNWCSKERPMIRKLKGGKYRLYSRKVNPKTGGRRNLGIFNSRKAAEQHERDIQYFKRH